MKETTKTALKSVLIVGLVGGGIYLIVLRTRHQQALASGAIYEADLEACGLDRECRRRVMWEHERPGEEYPGAVAMDAMVAASYATAAADKAAELQRQFPWLFPSGG